MIFRLFQKYTDNSTCHGIKYFGRANFLVPERIFWVFATFTFIFLASTVGKILLFKFYEKPIEIVIENTNFPLAEFPFPSVTICPTNNINFNVARIYLERFMNGLDRELANKTVYNVISALTLLKYPTYFQMRKYLKASRNVLKHFDSLNMTDFMLSVLPRCEDLLKECFWRGRSVDCCSIFTIQPTEEGFCYSFNDYTSAENKLCPLVELTKDNVDANWRFNCHPRFLTFSGLFSGLTIFTKSLETPETFLKDNQTFYPGFMVMVSTAYEYPEAGSGRLLQTRPGETLHLEVKPVMLVSDDKLSRIAQTERQCAFKAESEVLITKYYSLSSCQLTCRHNFIVRMCGCQLYFFFQSSLNAPLCKISQLMCIAKYSSALQLESPSVVSYSKPAIKDFPDCVCLPSCEGIWYDLGIKITNLTQLLGRDVTGLIDIYYERYGALKYKRKLAFSREDLIVSRMPSISIEGGSASRLKLFNRDKIQSIDKNYIKQYKKVKSYGLLKEFTQSSTIHGIQHIFREGETPLHRVIWSLFFATCLSGATYLIYDSWIGYFTVPIAVTVSDTNFPLDGVHFPAVSLCPGRKVVNSRANRYLAENLGNWIYNDTRISYFLEALADFQHPLYHNMAEHLNRSREILPRLEKLNITDLMINSLPRCEDLLLSCFWEAQRQNCCGMFSIQRSEEGFCYSFNSFTSERNKNCIYKDLRVNRDNCSLRSTGSTGPRSGLELLLKSQHKVSVRVHHPNDYPEAGMGYPVPIGELDKLNIGIKPTIIESADEIRYLSSEVTGCYFKDSKASNITRVYSQKSCLLECRMKFLQNQCHCLPYYVKMKSEAVSCNATQLHCIVENKGSLRFFRPPSDASKFSDDIKKTLDCTHCLPTCNERQYDLVIDLTKDTTARRYNYHAYVDVFYRTSGAVKYKRDMTYDYVQLLVNLGGIGGLFLGGSLLSLLEAVYWLSKALLAYLCPVGRSKVLAAHRQGQQRPQVFVTKQAWLN